MQGFDGSETRVLLWESGSGAAPMVFQRLRLRTLCPASHLRVCMLLGLWPSGVRFAGRLLVCLVFSLLRSLACHFWLNSSVEHWAKGRDLWFVCSNSTARWHGGGWLKKQRQKQNNNEVPTKQKHKRKTYSLSIRQQIKKA